MKQKRSALRRKYHFIYKTTCTVTNKHYFGMHSTDNMDDGYLGSGKILRYSIRKYGPKTHIREILEFLPNREQLREREEELIHKGRLKDPMCMNLVLGGGISDEQMVKISSSLKGRKLSKEHCRKMSLLKKGQVPWNKGLTKKNDKRIAQYSKTLSRVNTGKSPWNKGLTKENSQVVADYAQKLSLVNKGKKLSVEHRSKISGHVPWNKGLTKEHDKRLAAAGKKISKTRKLKRRQ